MYVVLLNYGDMLSTECGIEIKEFETEKEALEFYEKSENAFMLTKKILEK